MASSPIRSIRDALRALHRTLLDVERREYERSFGRIASDFYLLQLAAEDPQFAWLRDLATLMLDVDAMVANGDVSSTELRLLATRIRALTLTEEPMTPFQHRYQRILQEHPATIMAHGELMRLLPPASPVQIFRGSQLPEVQHVGDMRVRRYHPGDLMPGYGDHGYHALALVAESVLPPGTVVPMHEHRNEEIVSWVPEGEMHHDDPTFGKAQIDAEHPLVMNAGRGLSHMERTEADDPSLRMLQVFVRPREVDLEPHVQHASLATSERNTWRLVAAPKDDEAPFYVRNRVEIHDAWLDAGIRSTLPERAGWHAWIIVFKGEIVLDGIPLTMSEHALVRSKRQVSVIAREDSVLFLCLLDPHARITRAGTIGR